MRMGRECGPQVYRAVRPFKSPLNAIREHLHDVNATRFDDRPATGNGSREADHGLLAHRLEETIFTRCRVRGDRDLLLSIG